MTNGGWLDSNTADGMRLSLAEEFSDIHVYNLRGNQRTAGEQSRKEGGKVFGGGSRATVAITLLVKNPDHQGPATVHYTDIGDYLTREEKLSKIAEAHGVAGLDPVDIAPNDHGDWLNQRRDDFGRFMLVGDKRGGTAMFAQFAYPVLTARDAWVYNSSASRLMANLSRTIQAFNRHDGSTDPAEISWSQTLHDLADKGSSLALVAEAVRVSSYRPFQKQHLYFDRALIHRRGVMPRIYPNAETTNIGFQVTGVGSGKPFSVLVTSCVPDLAFWGSGSSQYFPLWTFTPPRAESEMLALEASEGEIINGPRKADNITHEALAHFQGAYGESFTKDDIFLYVYGLLHSPDYRETYAADLKKSLPRIPLVKDAAPFVEAGRRLSDLHLDYEIVEPYPLDGLAPDCESEAPYDFFRVEKMKFAKVRDPEAKKLVADKSTIIYNDRITLSGIPEAAYRYMLGSRSAIEWIIDRYQVKTDKASGIVNDPNDWSKEVEDPRYIIDLLARIVTVSLETMAIVDSLPALDIRKEQS